MPPVRLTPAARAVLAALCAAPLFAAPLLAGLSLAPTALVPVFVAVWMIWLMLVRPAHWRHRAVPGLALGALAIGVLLHGLLVAVLFAVGRGFAVLMAGAAAVPAWVAVALALVALLPAMALARAGTLDAGDVPADQGEPAGSGA